MYLLAFLIQSCDATNREINVDEFCHQIYSILSEQNAEEEELDKKASQIFYQNTHRTTPKQDIETRWEFLWEYAANHKMTGTLAKIISTTNEYSKDLQPNELSDTLKEEIIAAAMPEGLDTIDITAISTMRSTIKAQRDATASCLHRAHLCLICCDYTPV